jgi:hypothetical protein
MTSSKAEMSPKSDDMLPGLVSAKGRWVGESLYWDIDGQSISDEELKRWARLNLPDGRNDGPYITAYQCAAWAYRRRAIEEFMKNRVRFSHG